jgi:hypothetical protein
MCLDSFRIPVGSVLRSLRVNESSLASFRISVGSVILHDDSDSIDSDGFYKQGTPLAGEFVMPHDVGSRLHAGCKTRIASSALVIQLTRGRIHSDFPTEPRETHGHLFDLLLYIRILRLANVHRVILDAVVREADK